MKLHEIRDRVSDGLSEEAHTVWVGMSTDDQNEFCQYPEGVDIEACITESIRRFEEFAR